MRLSNLFKFYLIAYQKGAIKTCLEKAIEVYLANPRVIHHFWEDASQHTEISQELKEEFLAAATEKLMVDESLMAPYMLRRLVHSMKKYVSDNAIQYNVGRVLLHRLNMRKLEGSFLKPEFLESAEAFGKAIKGDGSTVSFYKTNEGKDVALKETSDPTVFMMLLEEFYAYQLAAGESDNLIKAVGLYYPKKDTLCLVMECAFLGDLLGILHKKKRGFNENEIIKVAHEAAQGLYFLHEQGLVHQDIKPDNIFVDEKGTIKIGDLGSVKKVSDTSTIRHSTICYTSLEVLLIDKWHDKKTYNKYLGLMGKTKAQLPRDKAYGCTTQSDMYGLMLALFTLLKNVSPFGSQGKKADDSDLLSQHMLQGHIAFQDTPNSPCLKTLLVQGIQHNPALRPRATEVIDATQGPYEKLAPGFRLI